MLRIPGRLPFLLIALLLTASDAVNQTANSPDPDLTRQPTLYVVGYAHLDTQWRWEYPQVIREYLPKTMRENFALFEKYPHYIFNFSGANRYRMMKEYWPQDYARLKAYVAMGRWFPAGSSMEEGTSIRPRPSRSSDKFFTVINIFVASLAAPARNICCPTVSVFLPRCPAFSRTPA